MIFGKLFGKKEEEKPAVLVREGIKTGLASVSKEDAIRAAGELLVELGAVGPGYIEGMLEREEQISTYMGMGIAIPHGVSRVKDEIKRSCIVVMQYPDGVDFGEEKAQLVFGIAGVGTEHMDLLSKIVNALEDEEVLEDLKANATVDKVMQVLG